MAHFVTPTSQKKSGFTILVAVLVVSVLLSVALGLAEIVLKENMLSSYLRESQIAFYAADRGIDCALFWGMAYDRNLPIPLAFSPFPTSTLAVNGGEYNYPSGFYGAPPSVVCYGTQLAYSSGWSVSGESPTGATTEFHLDFLDGSCTDVTVDSNGGTTLFSAQGFNTCDAANPRRTQRTLEVSTNL